MPQSIDFFGTHAETEQYTSCRQKDYRRSKDLISASPFPESQRHKKMLRENLLWCSLFFLFFINSAYPNDKQVSGDWESYKVSNTNIFDENDSAMTHNLNILYDKVEIKIDDRVVTIKNHLFNENKVCSIKYEKTKKTPISYFHSDKTVAMYKKMFSQEKVPLADYIYILTAREQSDTCPSTYNEILKNNDYLVVIDHYHAVFFRKKDTDSSTKKNHKNSFPDYCKDVRENK